MFCNLTFCPKAFRAEPVFGPGPDPVLEQLVNLLGHVQCSLVVIAAVRGGSHRGVECHAVAGIQQAFYLRRHQLAIKFQRQPRRHQG
jgi:hypothetical protein